MVAEWYIFCEDTQDRFKLGKGPWEGLKLSGLLYYHDEEVFADCLIEKWNNSIFTEPTPPEGSPLRQTARELWDYCEQRQWDVVLTNDCQAESEEAEWRQWPTKGSRYADDEVSICAGCGWPTRCKYRDCGCPAGIAYCLAESGSRGCSSTDCRACRACDPY